MNVDKQAAGVPLRDESDYEFVPLVGVGVEYEFVPKVSAYGNVSQAYRPKIFTEAVPTSPATTVAGDLAEGKSWLYEVGFRGNPVPYFNWDVSFFYMNFENQIGTVAGVIQNVGHSVHKGVETAFEVDLIGATDAMRGNDVVRDHALSLYGNAMLLDAEFVGDSPQDGNEPQYAPDYILRAGGIYRWKDRVKVAMLGTFVERHWANDGNTSFTFLAPGVPDPNTSGRVPAYMVWDLTAEAKVYQASFGDVSLIAGINNLFDEDYYARIRTDGIDPAYRRNYFGGVSFTF